MLNYDLSKLENNDFQHGQHFAGEPIKIIKKNENSLVFSFINTDIDVGRLWVKDYLKSMIPNSNFVSKGMESNNNQCDILVVIDDKLKKEPDRLYRDVKFEAPKPKKVTTRDLVARGMSVAAKIKNIVKSNVNKLDDKTMQLLTDKAFCQHNLGLNFPMFIEASNTVGNPNYKPARFSKKVMVINGNEYHMTNHFFEKHIPKIEDFFKAL